MGFFDYITSFGRIETKAVEGKQGALAGREAKGQDIFKAYIPNFLYRPPYGMPRKVNTNLLKTLSKNPYVFSVIKTLSDEATSLDWSIQVKDEYNDKDQDYETKISEVTKFFKNPNGNEQSLNHIFRQLITDICETDSAVLVKVFNTSGIMQQIFARDGSLFLKNPDIYGYMGDRQDFVAPLPSTFTSAGVDPNRPMTDQEKLMVRNYDYLYKGNAAYFQYGWTAGSMPVPFGRREIVYMMQNPRADSIYGRSPIEVLQETILNLIYGIEFNLDFYTNNNMPEGVISLLGANQQHVEQFRENFEAQFKYKDSMGNKRKKFFTYPISTSEVAFTPFQLSAKDMEIITQQEWFTKLVWMCFGVTADEMGFTEDSNKSVGESQIKVFKRKALKPLLNVLKYHFDSQIMPEFFNDGSGEIPDFGDTPLEFVFEVTDHDEDMKELQKAQLEINMGIKTSKMVAIERGIDIDMLEESKQEAMEEAQEMMPEEETEPEVKPKSEPEEKASNPLKEIDNYIDDIGKALIDAIDKIPEGDQTL